uniref:HYDIN axonemal central pair apparatus protein n=1 Tax=Anolis carolinensis TaxID=28377 RepID=A0A803TEP1_ANOCA
MVFPPQALIDSAKMLTDQSSKPPCPSSLLDGCQSKVVAPRNPKLVREEKKKDLTPSAFLKEMSLTTEQRLACTREMRRPRIVQLLDMSETSHQKFSSVDLDQSLFQPFPSEVIFQNFIPCEPYQVPLILRNNDKIPRLVKIVLESSPYFKVISPNDVCNKVAPGMPSTFHILFTPEENKDYFHELTCITEREKFIVPIRALGARGILDFPDQINFSTCPVKYNTQKMLLVRNIGNREAFYQITTQRPFSVEPSTGTLGIKEAAQFTIDFQPEKSGNHCQDLVVHYDTGEDIHVALYGAAADVNVRLDKNSLTVEKTYITLANQRSVVIHNRSDIIAHFQWKAFANPEEEEQKKQRLCQTLQAEEECLLDQLAMDCHLDPSLREHLAIVTRTFQSRQATVQEDALLFNNHIFSIEPVNEAPKWRLDPGKKGGPKMLHSLTNHCKENCSQLLQIPSHFSWALQPEAETRCKGGKTNKRPIGKANHRPGGRNSRHRPVSRVLLNFPPYFPLFRRQCWFLTCLLNKHTLFLSPRGCVIGPTFHFDVPSLSFGDVSFGFPSSLSCCLSNTSLVPLTFNLRVPGDGNGLPSVTSQDQATDIFRPSWRRKAGLGGLKPKEFSISPSYGTIRPQGAMDIQVTLCSNTVKSYETALMVDVKGSGEDVLALPITAKCLTPPLCLADPIMNFGHCFLRFPYQRMITLVNDSDLLGCYGVLPQPAESPAILHSSPVPCGIIQPCSTVEIPLTLEVQQRGRQEVTALVAIFGDQDLPLLQLVTFGEGPVVYVYPAELDFGSIPVLQDVSRVLFLANQSVIPAPFEAQMARPHSLWRIEPSSGIVPPEAEVSLSLIAHLNDTVLFQDKVHLAIEDSTSNIVPVQAAGIGTTIVTDKPFAPAIDLGPHFWYSLGPCFYRFQITNRGRRTHQLYWMTEGFRPFRLRPASLPAIGPSTKGKGPSRQDKVDSQFPVFKLRPLRMELTPGQSLDMQLEASSDTPKVIQEKLICHAIIGKQSGKEFIMTVDVSCQFIAPVLQISSKEITFRVEKNPRDILEAQYEPLALKNVSPLPLSLLLSLQEPFRLCDTDHEKLTAPHQPLLMEVEETRHLCIRFDPLYKDDLYNRAAEEVLTIRYLEHPHIDHINLRGEVYFPNLQFQTMNLDFGCILNDTEMIRDVTMTNCSPLHVKYRWSFLTNEPGLSSKRLPFPVKGQASQLLGSLLSCCHCRSPPRQVFDIMPLFGTLLPKETQKMSFTFYGHADIVARVKALCEVEGGPTYEVFLSGEASLVRISFFSPSQLFNHICVAEIILRNTGKVGFTYSVLDNVWASAENPPPGVPLTLPMTSYIESGKEQVLKIYYLPGIPEVFQRTFRIQVAHLEPDRITLKGEGIFPRICLDLPRNIRGRGNCIGTTIFMIRLLIQEHALEQQWLLAGNNPPEDSVGISQKVRRKLVKAQLPEYILDFGYIILGTVRSHIVKITNTSPFPVSFYADTRNLEDSGFCTGLDRVKNLPFCETETFEVLFDPQSANRPLGEVQVVLPIKVISGPTFNVSFRATVIMPSLCMSNENLEFSAVQCGQCQVETIQLHNQLQVNCEWFAHSSEQMKKVDKHMPAALRRKLRHELKTKPFVFEMIPPYGILVPGERFNVQVKFAPREEKSYRHYMIVSIAQSTQQLILTVSGQGFEPRLEFNPSIVELGPLLPYAAGDEAEVVVKNPCSFPIEFYSLEFDQQYLLEERILRMLKGYDSHHVLLLPPRIPGEKLPPEVLEFYEEQKKIQGDQEAANLDQEEEEEEEGDGIKAQVKNISLLSLPATGSQLSLVAKQKKAVGELDDNPVSKAIARHLGIDISPEGRAARNRRGIAIIIHGAPLTGKTGAAVTIAKHYNAACLSIDSVVMEAISDRSSSTGLRARELCLRAAIEQAQRENEEGGECLGSRLSGEALPKHLSDGSQQSSESKTGPLSNLSRGYRGSTVTAKGKSDSHGSQKQEKPPPQHLQSDQYSPQVRVPSSTIPGGPMQRRLSLSTSATEGYGLMSCVLPEELLVEILSERMQLSDCYRGIVIDGLETIFARSMTSVLLCLLKAINNRRYIYFVNLAQDFAAMKAKEKSKQEQEEQQEAMAREKARLQEMDEEEYDVLTEEQKIHFDSELLQAVRERKKREQERMARELEEKKHQQELERLREEEEMRKKSKRYKREVAKEKEEAAANAPVPSLKSDGKLNEGVERKSSAKDRAEAGLNDKDEKKKKGKPVLPDGQQAAPLTQEEEEAEKELMSESEKVLAQRFKLYEEAQKDLLQILMFWDRVQLVQLQPPGSEEKAEEVEDQRQAPSGRKGRKDRERERQERLEKERAEKERQERERLERERLEKLKAMEDRAFGQEGEGEGIEIGVPYLEIQVLSSEEASGKSILESGKLPNVVQVLNGLGLGPSGPPIPPTVFFSVIPFPEKRAPPVTGEALKHFTFLTSEELNVEEDKKDTEASSEATSSLPATKVGSQGGLGAHCGWKSGSKVETWMAGCCSGLLLSPPQKASPPETCFLVSRGSSPCRLNHYRWIVPANGEVTMRLHFSSNTTGLFDQVLNFEIVGTRRQYQLYCRGTCTYPTISTDPTVVFPHRKKTMKPDEMVCKKLVMSTNVFHFGPLLCGKSREKYKASRYPNHFERITILNISPLEAEVHFFFQYDSRAITYLLDPASITLKPNEKQLLTVWAYPTASGIFEDNIVCCIKDNPEPITFRICCQGVRPELELDRRQLHFEKVLLHRKETKPLYLKNATPLPVAWRISGMENIGDDFSLSEDTGIIGPFSEYCLLVNFKASKVLNIKKAIRLEVSDGENILGIVQIENIQIVAEAYDVALDISFPKGTNGGVELGIVRISDEAKQTLSLKNKGKYEIGFSFMVEATDHSMPNLAPMFSIQPQKGNLNPTDRPTQVQIVFRAKREVKIDDKPVLQCQVIEPNFIEGGETIATIPIRLSVHCGYSKYSITPPSLINFGPLMISSRKSSSFTIENKGTLDFKFFILKNSNIKSSRSREVDLSRQNMGRQSKRAESLQKDMNLVAQARFSLGMFTVYPGFGTISPGGHQVITVDCFADQVGKSEEYLIVEVTERDPEDNPAGILYTLVAESCIPGFVTDDPKIIFEEHRICNRSSLSQVLKMVGCEGVFVKDENKFIFTNVLVGSQASARFKIFNNTRIPCDVVLATKPISAKSPVRIADVFDIHPVRMCIPSRSYAFATLNFSPQTMQSYHCIFEASVDAPASVSSKSKHLLFEVSGDGNLPQVTVVRPVLRNKKGAPLLLFRRLLLGHTEMLPLLIKNSGNIPVQLYLDVSDENSAFSLKPTSTTQCTYMNYKTEEHGPSEGGKGKPHTASLFLPIEESAEFEVVFHPSLTQRLEGQIRLSIVDNQYEETRIQMVGEGYQEDVTLDNIRSLMDGGESGSAEEHLGESTAESKAKRKEDLVSLPAAARLDHIWFGDCIVGKPYQATFTITNHSKTDAMRFEWPALNPHLTFSPQVGHLHASCSKNTILTFKAKAPLCIREQLLKCKVSRIAFPQPADQVPDWDDRQHTVKWVDVSKASGNPRPVIEKDPEPAYLPLEEGGRELELRVSAIVDYAQYKLEVDAVHFKDTLLFQTRVFKVELFNTGNVQLEYSWNVVVDESARLVNFATEPGRPSTQLGSMLESFSSYLFPTPTRPPFLLEPRNGTIPHGRSQILQVKFSPQEVGEFEGRLICSILNLKAEEVGPVVTVKGKGLLPYCHFDLEDSDYITAKRRNPELRGPGGAGLAPDTKVIEFTSVGVHVRNTNFVIMNPTNTPYSFHWTCQQQQQKGGQDPPVFICFTDRGQLRPEKTMEIIFEFIPRHVDITESFWSFSIPELGIVVPFLLVGHTTDPEVYLDRPHLNFHSLLVGHEARESVDIINNEKDTYSFSFRDSSRFSEGRINSLKVHPMEGSILPSSRVPVTIFFTPTLEGEVNFNLLCDVKSKSQPLCLNVKATGHAMSVSVKRQRSDGSMKELDPDQTNRLPFHEMQVNDFTQYHFYILNTGKFNFFFSWEFCHAKAVQRYFAIAPETAVVEVGERGLLISHGPTFTCALQGVVVAPSLHFSFTKVDFGNCFIYHAGMPILKRTLIITNKDKKVVSLNCLFTNTAYLELSFRTEVLSPGGKVEIPISFYPREAVSYHEVITFEINGLLQRTVEVSGKGIEMKIEVVEPRSKVMKFGAVPLGHTVKKMATIVNNSVAFVTFQLNFVSSVPELHDAKVLTMSPSGEIALNPKGDTCHVEVTFAPRNRLLPFTEEVIFECQGVLRTLFAIQGCSQGIQVSLDQDHVPFGAVVLRSQATRRIVMQNTGDLGVGFKWEAKRFKPDFSIRPLEGYISPGMDVAFEVTFHPCELSPDICYENLPCHIQGGEPLRLTLTGCCVGVPAVKEVVNFICQVRAKHTQTIMLTNRTNQPWTLQPIIEGEQWKGAEFIRVEAHQQNKPYEITYRPLAMNAENKKDQGSVFFPLPDGTGLLYLLQGTAEPPKSAGNIMREVPCKTTYTELLPVSNWLSKPQRFRVTIDMLKPEKLEVTTTLKTLDYLEVPASAKKDHKLTFYSYREGIFSAKVTFRNESTQEFLFYLLTFKATPCGPLGTIELTSPVRQIVSSSVKVENPLSSPVTFSTDCKVPDINMPSQFVVPAQSEGVLAFDFQPMRVGESGGRLALNSTDLGSFQYDLVLKATPPRAEKTLHFSAMLGSSQNIVAKFVNYTRQKTEYSTKIDCPDFHVDKVVNAPAGSQGGSEVGVEVTFEPCQLGESQGTLALSSPIGGDYVIPLCGTCVPPRPQGPIQIKAGTATTIPFKNVFLQSMSFTYLVEHPAFTIKATETIRSKKSASIVVSFEGTPGSNKAPVTSRLVVSCPRAAGLGARVSWVYYLKGIVPEK